MDITWISMDIHRYPWVEGGVRGEIEEGSRRVRGELDGRARAWAEEGSRRAGLRA